MRLIMMGTGPFAVPTFRALLQSQHQVPLLVTRPAPTIHTRGVVPRNWMRECAEQAGIPIFEPEDINTPESQVRLRAESADLFVVCDYGQILSGETLSIPPLGGINLHGSLLPKYRGAAPIQWAILRGETTSGVTVIHMTPRLDAGPSLVQVSTPIDAEETAAELEPRLAELGIAAVNRALELLANWDRQSVLGTPQDRRQASRAPRLKKSDGHVNWSDSAEQIQNQIRALKPWPGTYTHWLRPGSEPLRLILDHVHITTGQGVPGTVLRASGKDLIIATADQAIAIDQLQPAGKRLMDTETFLRGYRVQAGDRCDTANG
jgi:methionyl-tRNA formyltransferase